MSLYKDILLAEKLLLEKLSSSTRPTEKEARAAARRVLQAVCDELRNRTPDDDRTGWRASWFLHALANVIDPASTPKEERSVYTRTVDFKDTTRGAEKSRAAFTKNLQIAEQVYLLNKADKNGNSLVAKYYGKDPTRISHICNMPEIKHFLTNTYGELTAADATEILGPELELLELGYKEYMKQLKRKPVRITDKLDPGLRILFKRS